MSQALRALALSCAVTGGFSRATTAGHRRCSTRRRPDHRRNPGDRRHGVLHIRPDAGGITVLPPAAPRSLTPDRRVDCPRPRNFSQCPHDPTRPPIVDCRRCVADRAAQFLLASVDPGLPVTPWEFQCCCAAYLGVLDSLLQGLNFASRAR